MNRELEALNDEKKIKNNIYLKAKEKHNFQESKIANWYSLLQNQTKEILNIRLILIIISVSLKTT
ncbi:hypothetical protein MUO_03585 [Listeria monocytogenes 07PF0776]|nr:hypothetical protein MUO_03585 [Listeria monocytogenes 07PF0776]